ncbi:MAG: EAL domain-containing protein, partial [Lachnospiraceae bacterium]|nr:EAL domain-containing protein [Lachnospiraceae bacterium]
KNAQIHKLDMFIVERVCSDIGERKRRGVPYVPVSVNFSRLDFEMCNVLEIVEKAVKKNDIARNFIRIEITESMVLDDVDLMSAAVRSFRKKGYEVWMDDFGSGYSSLSVLKDWDFDLIKYDMFFLSTLSSKSKHIMNSMVSMAKNINFMTLAEGVEEKEQVDFLRDIGVEKLQGYYYGKPMPLEDFFDNIKARNIGVEKREWKEYYDAASCAARYSENPLEIIEDTGEQIKTLFMNEPYKKEIKIDSYDLDEVDDLIYKIKSPLVKKYNMFAEKIENSNDYETFYYTYQGDLLRFTGKTLAKKDDRYILSGSIRNISEDRDALKNYNIDIKLNELSNLFEAVLELDLDANTFQTILGHFSYDINYDSSLMSNEEAIELFTQKFIYPGEFDRYMKYMNLNTLAERIDKVGNGYLSDLFRIKAKNGKYEWKEVLVMMLAGSRAKKFLYCIRELDDKCVKVFDKYKVFDKIDGSE